ncbi:MAG: septal ring lytic transglycosylase RlpA family protein [Verrucomicrobiae bacterium]|nr:septal ring lytic transglycosylase RlpA family protein [Verrucomicrobiae bacterium]
MKWFNGFIMSFCLLALAACVNTHMGGGKTEGRLNASWYGEQFHGRQTASGEVYNMYDKTAAHRSLPFGTLLRVRNLANQRVTTVKVNDRGPFVRGRDLDLSYAAAKDLDMISQGVAEVYVENLGRAGGYQKTVQVAAPVAQAESIPRAEPVGQALPVTIQVGSFREKENAEHVREGLALNYSSVFIEEAKDQGVYRVRVGHFASREEADPTAQQLAQEGYSAWIVAD